MCRGRQFPAMGAAKSQLVSLGRNLVGIAHKFTAFNTIADSADIENNRLCRDEKLAESKASSTQKCFAGAPLPKCLKKCPRGKRCQRVGGKYCPMIKMKCPKGNRYNGYGFCSKPYIR